MGIEPLQGLSTSVQIAQYTFPARRDYEHYFIAKGQIVEAEQLWTNSSLVEQLQRHWHSRGQNGCVFAQALASKAGELGWQTYVVQGQVDQSALTVIDESINNAIQCPSNNILSILFPRIVSDVDLTNMLKIVRNSRFMSIQETQLGQLTSLAIRMPLNQGQVTSWVVGFGPFTFLPETRQSPITEIAVRTKLKPVGLFHRLNQDMDVAHLADVSVGLSDQVMERIWQATFKRTRELLGGSERRNQNKFASAKVTFAIPTALWLNNHYD